MEGHPVRGIRYAACGSAISVLILASPGIALLMLVVVEMPIDLLMNLMALALLSLTTVGALGWFVLQRQAALSDGALCSIATYIPKNRRVFGLRQIGANGAHQIEIVRRWFSSTRAHTRRLS
jgi:hypothetical protein